ncbi:MAG TPA: biotin--[acetyl-CoA-carboxylase] ligase [Candidatus Eisenbacteria bacterium]|nr:biotin--[acetyl-CoA-carboxylase] ligase [Candidatus Eisenbacteria bacterium]
MNDDPVLDFLREKKDGYVSGEEMSRRLKVSRAAVWKGIEVLRRLGYEVESRAGQGYRLTGIPDKMFADEIAYGLKTRMIGKKIFSYEDLDSTNDAAWRLGEEGLPEGACVFAEHQKKGRGRMGRSWLSPKGKGVLLSVLLRPKLSPAEAARVTLMTAVSAARAMKKHVGKAPGIKWPNDLLYGGKKVCGILTEMSAELDRVKFVVVGIGVNVNASAKDLPPGSTSLREAAGRAVSRQDFARDLLTEMEADYLRLKDGRFEEIVRDWEDHSATSGKRVTATVFGRKIQGQAVGIDSDGALWIRRDNGLQERVLAGDVQHLDGVRA